MKAILFDGKPVLVTDYPDPVPSPTQARIKVTAAGICRTDLEIIKGYMGFKGVMGHEFVGVVEECHNKQWKGKRVAGEINITCGECMFCKNGMGNHCTARRVIGIDGADGCFAEYLVLPMENLHLVPDSVSDEEATFIEPLAACFRIAEQLHLQPKSSIVVLGAGRLGLLAAQVFKLQCADVTVIAKHQPKLELAQSLGLRTAPAEDTRIRSRVVIDCTGAPEGFDLARKLVIPGGTIVLKSTFHQKAHLDIAPLVVNEINLLGSRCGPFRPAVNALDRNYIRVEPLISARYSLDEGLAALESAGDPARHKTLITMQE